MSRDGSPTTASAATDAPRRRWPQVAGGVTLIVAAAVVLAVAVTIETDDDAPSAAAVAPSSTTSPVAPTTGTTTTTEPPFTGWWDPGPAGQPYGDTVAGLLTFRGNPSRTYYGAGPVPLDPEILWTFPAGDGGLCSTSSGEQWCGTGWTGQPAVWEQGDHTWVAFGAYDAAVHWLDADTGERLLPDFAVGDIIKGSVTVDPDGYPLLYTGSRDSFFRIIAMDRDEPVELYRLSADAVSPTKWNDDWDGSAIVLDDFLFEGGENGQFHVLRLNRGYDDDGLATVDPELVFNAPGWDDEQLAAIGDSEVSIENSVAISGDTVWFSNSGGLLQGWDIAGLRDGVTPTRTHRLWLGEDMDASVVVDEDGFLYVGVEYEKGRQRARDVGQVLKIDPERPDEPIVWAIHDSDALQSGVWATAAIHGDVVYVPLTRGELLAIDRTDGEVLWSMRFDAPTWQSPVVVDDVLLFGDCSGVLHAFDVSDPRIEPPELWTVQLAGCIESTPAVWDGRIYVGARGGQFYAIGDAP